MPIFFFIVIRLNIKLLTFNHTDLLVGLMRFLIIGLILFLLFLLLIGFQDGLGTTASLIGVGHLLNWDLFVFVSAIVNFLLLGQLLQSGCVDLLSYAGEVLEKFVIVEILLQDLDLFSV